MKRYLWTAVAVLCVNGYASENPFALKENLQLINNEQDALLSELSRIAEERDAALDAEDAEIEAELEKEAKIDAELEKESLKKNEGDIGREVDAALEAEDAEIEAELQADAKKHGLTLAEDEEKAKEAEQAKAKEAEKIEQMRLRELQLEEEIRVQKAMLALQEQEEASEATLEKQRAHQKKLAELFLIEKKKYDLKEKEEREAQLKSTTEQTNVSSQGRIEYQKALEEFNKLLEAEKNS